MALIFVKCKEITEGESVLLKKSIQVSIIIPVKDEVESVPILAEEIEEVMGRQPWNYECIWIDDGSTDGSFEALTKLARRHKQHRVVQFRQNFGQSAAMAAGFRMACGQVLVTLDSDLQNDPRDIPLLVQKVFDGEADMINGRRSKRRDNWIRKISSRIANGFRNRLTHSQVTDVGCSLRAFRRECVQKVPVFKGMHRFLPTLVELYGYKITEMPVRHRERRLGKTKYGINNRLWVGLADTFAVRWMQKRLVDPAIRQTINFERKEE